MGYDLHITRAAHWIDSEQCPITADEWLRFVQNDPDLEIDPRGNGPYFALWMSHWIDVDHPWFDWDEGQIQSKHPDRKTVGKMLQIARFFGAKVVGDDGEVYASLEDVPDD